LTNKSDIEHLGQIESILGDQVTVNFITQSACSSCHAKGACSAADMQEKEIKLKYPEFKIKTGDQVWVVLKQSLGFKAVFLGYIFPLILIIVILITLSPALESEGKAGLASLGAVAIYYATLYIFREKIDKQFIFTLKQIS